MSMTYSDHVYSNACEKILSRFESSAFDEVEFLKLMQDELCKEIDRLKARIEELEKENQRLKELSGN